MQDAISFIYFENYLFFVTTGWIITWNLDIHLWDVLIFKTIVSVCLIDLVVLTVQWSVKAGVHSSSQVTPQGHHQHANASGGKVGFKLATNVIRFYVFAMSGWLWSPLISVTVMVPHGSGLCSLDQFSPECQVCTFYVPNSAMDLFKLHLRLSIFSTVVGSPILPVRSSISAVSTILIAMFKNILLCSVFKILVIPFHCHTAHTGQCSY